MLRLQQGKTHNKRLSVAKRERKSETNLIKERKNQSRQNLTEVTDLIKSQIGLKRHATKSDLKKKK